MKRPIVIAALFAYAMVMLAFLILGHRTAFMTMWIIVVVVNVANLFLTRR